MIIPGLFEPSVEPLYANYTTCRFVLDTSSPEYGDGGVAQDGEEDEEGGGMRSAVLAMGKERSGSKRWTMYIC